ncbi:MAG: hypothetical protein ABI433_00230 [Burkholderiaceae bacterium]
MPVTAADEWMHHQTASTFDHVDNSDMQWTERVWLAAFEKTGRMQIAFGLGKYANRNVMDASIAITVDGKTQYNVRASRALFPDPEVYEVGSLSYEIVDPLRRLKVTIGANEHGVRGELEFVGNTEVSEQKPQMFRRRNGRLVNHMIRYFQAGHLQGSLEIDGVRHELRAEDWWAGRDRSWGIRSATGEFCDEEGNNSSLVQGLQQRGNGVPYRWNFFILQFRDWFANYEFAESPDGARMGPALGHLHFTGGDKRTLKIVDVKHRWTFVPGTKRIVSIHESIHTDDGEVREVLLEPVSICYRRPGGGLYGGWKGNAQGLWMGPQWEDGDRQDLTDPETLTNLHFVDDHALRCTFGDEVGHGLAEPLIPGRSELLTT